MNKETKRKVLKIAKKAIKVTHKISIFGLQAYLNIHTGEITSTIKLIRWALIILLGIRNYYYADEPKEMETSFKVVEKFDKERYIA